MGFALAAALGEEFPPFHLEVELALFANHRIDLVFPCGAEDTPEQGHVTRTSGNG
jgi:hypothetical protein